MLRKLLKYDFKSVWRVWWIMAVGVLGLACTCAGVLAFIINNANNNAFALIHVFGIMFVALSVLGIFSSVLITYILVFLRYYKHFFTDEGYLTFTLPVKRRTLLLSKTLNAAIWTALQAVLIVGSVLIIMLPIPSHTGGSVIGDLFREIGRAIAQQWNEIGAWTIVYAVEAILFIAVIMFFSISLIQFCISVGAAVAKKAKIIAAIGIYYGANMVISTLTQIFGLFGLAAITEGYSTLLENASFAVCSVVSALSVLVIILVIAAASTIIYFSNLGILERKLNLS